MSTFISSISEPVYNFFCTFVSRYSNWNI